MKSVLEARLEDGTSREPETVLARGTAVACDGIGKARTVVERVSTTEGLLVLRVATLKARPKSVPAHFLVLSYAVEGACVVVETDPVMVLPGRKGGYQRDVRSWEPYGGDDV